LEGVEYLIMKEDEVLAAIEGAASTATTKSHTTRKGR
jgi:hypothetical protein